MEENQPQQPTSDSGSFLTPFTEGLVDLRGAEIIGAYLQKFSLVPPPVKNILQDFATAEYIEDKLGHDFILDDDQKRGIAKIIREVLLGELYLGDMGTELNKQYEIEYQAAKDIAQRIQIQLFTPALDDIKRIQQERFAQRTNSITPAPVPSSQNAYQPPQDINPSNIVDLRKQQ